MEKINFKEMTFEERKKWMLYGGFALAGLLLIFYLFSFSYIWNSDYGSEASVSGWGYIFACIGWNFKSPSKVFGELSGPFNIYAKYFVRVLAVFSLVSFLVLIAFVILNGLNTHKFSKKKEIATNVILYVLSAVFLGCIIVGLTMNASRILPRYCGGNPKCSIATLAFFPFFFTLAGAIIHTVFIHKNKEDLNNEGSPKETLN